MVHDLNLLEAAVAAGGGGGGRGRDSGTASLYFQVGEYEAASAVGSGFRTPARESICSLNTGATPTAAKTPPIHGGRCRHYQAPGPDTSPTRGHRELKQTCMNTYRKTFI